MGSWTDAKIAAWQAEAGIKPAEGEKREALEALSKAAFELIKIIPLEASGIRDGDGYWYYGDPVGGIMRDVMALCQCYLEARWTGKMLGGPSACRHWTSRTN